MATINSHQLPSRRQPTARAPGQHRPSPAEHRRNKSASSVLKSIIAPNREATRAKIICGPTSPTKNDPSHQRGHNMLVSLPPDHPHAQALLGKAGGALEEIRESNEILTRAGVSPRKMPQRELGLHKKSKSSISLYAVAASRESESPTKGRFTRSRPKAEASGRAGSREEAGLDSKAKSSTNLAALFLKHKSPSKEKATQPGHSTPSSPTKVTTRTLMRDQENITPPNSAGLGGEPTTPIWAQFQTMQTSEEPSGTGSAGPEGHADEFQAKKAIEDEIALYTPNNYSPTKQRNFFEHYRNNSALPSTKRPGPPNRLAESDSKAKSQRPTLRSAKPASTSLVDTLKRDNAAADSKRQTASTQQTNTKRGSRVMDAVAAFNNRTRGNDTTKASKHVSKDAKTANEIDDQQLDDAFEAMLENRNIPREVREKLRGVTTHVKQDFLKKHTFELLQGGSSNSSKTSLSEPSIVDSAEMVSCNEKDGMITSRAATKKQDGGQASFKTRAEEAAEAELSKVTDGKRSRPRSRTFTFSKSKDSGSASKADTDSKDESPKKKQRGRSRSRPKSIEIPKSPSALSLSSLTSARGVRSGSVGSMNRKSVKSVGPEEFIKYLKAEQKPQEVEVGRLHKLRLLLRNETVAWVDAFIEQGGMSEMIGLLDRIMDVEWREEHEDALLNEVLLCLKGLCTTDLALEKLCEIQGTLFPKLLAMLFDPEHKGPSEFNTRGIIISLLLVHLTAAVDTGPALVDRARTILSHLMDPKPPEDKRPLPFILEMHKPRPYKLWHTEVSNVTKEVFWIFQHNLNVIALPQHEASSITLDGKDVGGSGLCATPRLPTPPSADSFIETLSAADYASRFFPRQRAPVPAAPYVGGVEWDATHYLASHVDLLNGLVAALPTRDERNTLRQELRDSGWEKVMGGCLRTCKEKFYGHVHEALRCWVGAACADGWDGVGEVRMGPRKENKKRTVVEERVLKKAEEAGEARRIDGEADAGQSKKGYAELDLEARMQMQLPALGFADEVLKAGEAREKGLLGMAIKSSPAGDDWI